MTRLLLGTLAAASVLAAVIHAQSFGSDRRTFSATVTPAAQSMARGEAAAFSLDLARRAGFTGATTFRLAALPRGMRARWRLADGTRSRLIPSGESGLLLTLHTSARTPLGTRRLRLIATAGSSTVSRRLAVTVVPRRLRIFTLRVGPARRTVTQGAPARFKVRVDRAAGFRGRVALRVVRRPRPVRAAWAGSTLTLATNADQPLGSRRLVIRGTSRVEGRIVRRYRSIVLTVVRSRSFGISGDAERSLRPGVSGPLNLVLTNPHRFDIRVVSLVVRLRPGTTKPGCDAAANYVATQFRGGYPLVLRPGSTPLSALRPGSWTWPRVGMRDLPVSQDACRGARLSLGYSGQAMR